MAGVKPDDANAGGVNLASASIFGAAVPATGEAYPYPGLEVLNGGGADARAHKRGLVHHHLVGGGAEADEGQKRRDQHARHFVVSAGLQQGGGGPSARPRGRQAAPGRGSALTVRVR